MNDGFYDVISNSDEDLCDCCRVNHLIQRALGEISLRLESSVSKDLPGENVVFSPLSIASVLAIVLLGARGVTHAEVARLLGVTAGVSLTGR